MRWMHRVMCLNRERILNLNDLFYVALSLSLLWYKCSKLEINTVVFEKWLDFMDTQQNIKIAQIDLYRTKKKLSTFKKKEKRFYLSELKDSRKISGLTRSSNPLVSTRILQTVSRTRNSTGLTFLCFSTTPTFSPAHLSSSTPPTCVLCYSVLQNSLGHFSLDFTLFYLLYCCHHHQHC